MKATTSILTFGLATAVLTVVGYAALREDPAPRTSAERVDDLEARLARVEEAGAVRAPRTEDGPTLRGRRLRGPTPTPADSTHSPAPVGDASAALGGRIEERIEDHIEELVEKKAARLRVMRDKKPPIDVFAKTLDLTDEQRWDVVRDVLRGQHALYALLDTPTADGSILLDDLVEVLAHGMAYPEEGRQQWARFLGRVLTETIPGTDDTYALRAEAVKASVREDLRRTLSNEQYALFEAWQLDPTEIQEIEGSPWNRLRPRVFERARALGAEVSDDA